MKELYNNSSVAYSVCSTVGYNLSLYSRFFIQFFIFFRSNYILESSFIPCENLIEGRLSFRGMNPEIERLLELEDLAKRPPIDRSMKTDVTDSEMAQYGLLIETVASKYKTKKDRKSKDRKGFVEVEVEHHSKQNQPPPRKKAKFLKPKDE